MNFFSKYIVLFIADKVTREPSSFLSVLDMVNIFLIPSHFLLSLIQKKPAAAAGTSSTLLSCRVITHAIVEENHY